MTFCLLLVCDVAADTENKLVAVEKGGAGVYFDIESGAVFTPVFCFYVVALLVYGTEHLGNLCRCMGIFPVPNIQPAGFFRTITEHFTEALVALVDGAGFIQYNDAVSGFFHEDAAPGGFIRHFLDGFLLFGDIDAGLNKTFFPVNGDKIR